MSSSHSVKEFLSARVGAAAERIHKRYEEKTVQCEEELNPQRRLLNISRNPQIQLHNIAIPRCYLEGDGDSCDHRKTSSVKQEGHDVLNVKEEQEELYISQGKEQLPKSEDVKITQARGEGEQSEVDQKNHQFQTQNWIPNCQDREELQYEESTSVIKEENTRSDPGDKIVNNNGNEGDNRTLLENLCEAGFKESFVYQWFIVTEKQTPNMEDFSLGFVRRENIAPRWGLNVKRQTNKATYFCEECGKKFTKGHSLKVHMRIHTGEKPFSCTVCDRRFNRNVDLKSHMRTHTGEKPFSCSECGKSFSRKSILVLHVRTHTKEKPFSCEVCGKDFSKRFCLNLHMRTHTGEKPFTCTSCGASFDRAANLESHMRTHTGEKPFSCTVCGKCFGQSTHMKSHLRIHTGEKPFNCTVCGKGFSQKCTLNTHIKTHTGEKPFSCRECGRSFSKKFSLNSHMRTHTGEKPFNCTICGKNFSHKSSIKAHMGTHKRKSFLGARNAVEVLV